MRECPVYVPDGGGGGESCGEIQVTIPLSFPLNVARASSPECKEKRAKCSSRSGRLHWREREEDSKCRE